MDLSEKRCNEARKQADAAAVAAASARITDLENDVVGERYDSGGVGLWGMVGEWLDWLDPGLAET